MFKIIISSISLLIVLAGCSQATQSQQTPAQPQERVSRPVESATATSPSPTANISQATASEESQVSDGIRAAPPLEIPSADHELSDEEYVWRQLLPRDGIRPIYEDEVQFVPADEAPYSPDELVIGVEINGEARAYAIGPLNRREMVNDTIGGTPILVTW